MKSARARRMGDRVVDALVRVGLGADDVARVRRAYVEAIRWREDGDAPVVSDRHPAFLHPGRTMLILADDVNVGSAVVLAAAALVESRDLALRVPDGAMAGSDDEALGLREEVPSVPWSRDDGDARDADAALLEELVTSRAEVQQIALAEALDQIRHAHLWDRPSDRVRAAELTSRVFAPLAERVDPTLARRYRWWERRVGAALSRDGG